MIKKFFLIHAFIIWASCAFAATYYVDATLGSDDNDGLSEGTAWQSLSKLNQFTFSPGDTICFKAGESWNNENGLLDTLNITYSGTEDNPITFTRYGEGENPQFYGLRTISGGWTYMGNNVWKQEGVSQTERVLLGDIETTKAGGTGSMDEDHRWYYNSSESALYVYATENPDLQYGSVQTMDPPVLIYLNGASNIQIENIDFAGAGKAAIKMENGGSNITIKDCNFTWTGYYGIWVRGKDAHYTNITIEGNFFDTNYNPVGWDPDDDMGPEDLINFGSNVSDSYIGFNTFYNAGHAGVYLNGRVLDADASGLQNNIIEFNIFDNQTNPYSRAFCINGTMTDGTKASGNIVRNNYITGANIRSQLGGDSNYVYNNLFFETVNTDHTEWRSQALLLGTVGPSTNNTIYNNTFISSDDGAIRLEGYGVTGNVIYDNTFIQGGGYDQQILFREQVNPDDNMVLNNYFDTSDSAVVFYTYINGTRTYLSLEEAEALYAGIYSNMIGDGWYSWYYEAEYSDPTDPVNSMLVRKIKRDLFTYEVMGEYRYYQDSTNRLELIMLTQPDGEGNVYYHFINEDWNGTGFGRMDVSLLGEANDKGEIAFEYEYYDGIYGGQVHYKRSYTEAGMENLYGTYEYATDGSLIEFIPADGEPTNGEDDLVEYYDSGRIHKKEVPLEENPDSEFFGKHVTYYYLDEDAGAGYGRIYRVD
ncbi:MAG: right-handed parallel beta-helix repeat-containing protein, partial [Candidatus Omnitrophica bacterium]|nr:right-handed parallel beta-helix repeat-containing protein [Candidatus Omnitrophota bacterium]